MTTIQNHREILRELLDDIDEKIRNDLLVERQKILGFALSEATCHMLAILLLSKKLISSGFMINHRYFSSEKRAFERLGFDFEKKNEILAKMVKQEELRDKLCYGNNKERDLIEKAIRNMYALKEIIEGESSEPL